MTRKAKTTLTIVAVAAGLLPAGLWFLFSSSITPANYARIEKGMTFQAVKTILGKPGNHETGLYHIPKWNLLETDHDPEKKGETEPHGWFADRHHIIVEFWSKDGTVASKSLFEVDSAHRQLRFWGLRKPDQ